MFTMISFLSSWLKKRRGKHSHGRQSTCYVCGNTPTADKVHNTAGWSTLTADRVLAKFAEILRRPTKYTMLQDRIPSRPTEYLLQLRKYYNGRQSTSAICTSIVTADRVPDATEWNTLTADKVLATLEETLSRPTEFFRKFIPSFLTNAGGQERELLGP